MKTLLNAIQIRNSNFFLLIKIRNLLKLLEIYYIFCCEISTMQHKGLSYAFTISISQQSLLEKSYLSYIWRSNGLLISMQLHCWCKMKSECNVIYNLLHDMESRNHEVFSLAAVTNLLKLCYFRFYLLLAVINPNILDSFYISTVV